MRPEAEVIAVDALAGLLRDHIADRWMRWRALHWCAQLADADVCEFEHAILQMPRVVASGVRPPTFDTHGSRFAEDARLAASPSSPGVNDSCCPCCSRAPPIAKVPPRSQSATRRRCARCSVCFAASRTRCILNASTRTRDDSTDSEGGTRGCACAAGRPLALYLPLRGLTRLLGVGVEGGIFWMLG